MNEKKDNVQKAEELFGRLCDEYCRFPTVINDDDTLDEICMKCPLNEVFDLIR